MIEVSFVSNVDIRVRVDVNEKRDALAHSLAMSQMPSIKMATSDVVGRL
jgi:hypothetical protein